jgi:hypothetical protein
VDYDFSNHLLQMWGHNHCIDWTAVLPEIAEDPSAVRALTEIGNVDPVLIERGLIADPALGRDVLTLTSLQAEQFLRFADALAECDDCRAVFEDAVDRLTSKHSDKVLCIYRNLLPCFREHDVA